MGKGSREFVDWERQVRQKSKIKEGGKKSRNRKHNRS